MLLFFCFIFGPTLRSEYQGMPYTSFNFMRTITLC